MSRRSESGIAIQQAGCCNGGADPNKLCRRISCLVARGAWPTDKLQVFNLAGEAAPPLVVSHRLKNVDSFRSNSRTRVVRVRTGNFNRAGGQSRLAFPVKERRWASCQI